MKKTFRSLAAALALTAALSSCYTLNHQVGNGAQGSSEHEQRQWYALYGLVPLNDVSSHEMAAGATNYDVKTQMSVLDVVIVIFTGWITVVSRTVTVTK